MANAFRITIRRVAAIAAAIAIPILIVEGCVSSRPQASGGGGSGPAGLVESCNVVGATRECHVLLSAKDNVRTCMAGVQTCAAAGFWGACLPSNDGLLESIVAPPPEGWDESNAANSGLHTQALSTASADGRACSSPCNPDCIGWSEDAGPITPIASNDITKLLPFNGTNPGFESFLQRDDCPGHSYSKNCELAETANANTANPVAACQADSYCSVESGGLGGTGCCTRFASGQAHGDDSASAGKCADALPDLTIGNPCKLGTAVVAPLCNRGGGPVTAGSKISVTYDNPAGVIPYTTGGTTCPSLAVTPQCEVPLAADLAPGECVNMVSTDHCVGTIVGGNRVLLVNNPGFATTLSECSIDVNDTYSTVADRPACQNNFSAFQTTQLELCPTLADPIIITQQYPGTCGTGSVPQWGKLAYRVSTPGTVIGPLDTRSYVTFEVRVADRFDDGGIGPWSGWFLVAKAQTGGDPQDCRMDGTVAGCPKDLYAVLGDLQSRYEVLEVRITLQPYLANLPTLYSWDVAYSCVAAE